MDKPTKKQISTEEQIACADAVNIAYMKSLADKSGGGVVFRYLTTIVAPLHEQKIEELTKNGSDKPAIDALDHLGEIIRKAYPQVLEDIKVRYPEEGVEQKVADKNRQSLMQSVKSNAGKVFERYVGYAVARALHGTGWAIWHNTASAEKALGIKPSDWLKVTKKYGEKEVTIEIEGDLLIAMPGKEDGFLILLSVKTSLKDRFHNVALWNLVKVIAADDEMAEKIGIKAVNKEKLQKVIYCVAASDIAEEQKDLAEEPRKKIKFDAALLDYAFAAVDADHLASTLGDDGRGEDLFHRLSSIGDILSYIQQGLKDDIPDSVEEAKDAVSPELVFV